MSVYYWCSLDPRHSPKGPCVEVMVPRLWCHCRLMEHLRDKAQWQEVRPLVHTLDMGLILPVSVLASTTGTASSVLHPCRDIAA